MKKLSAAQKQKLGALTVVWASDPPDYPPNEWDLYGVAQTIADPKHVHDAIDIMKVELEEYPKFLLAYRYLGELYVRAGQKALAIQTWEKVLNLNPGDREATEALNKLH